MIALCNGRFSTSSDRLQRKPLAERFAFCKAMGMSDLTPTAFAQAVSISVPYASQLLSGSRDISRDIAIRAFRALGVKLGPIAGASDAEIDVLERFEEKGPVRAAAVSMAVLVDDPAVVAPDPALGAGAKSGALQ